MRGVSTQSNSLAPAILRARRVDVHALVAFHERPPRHADQRPRKELDVAGSGHAHREQQRIADARAVRVELRRDAQVADGAAVVGGTPLASAARRRR